MNKQSGFSIIELMITVVIAGIVLGFGVPSFRQFMNDNRIVTQVNNLVTALNLARSEAVTRGVAVDVVPIVPGDWTAGWTVGIDNDDNGSFTGPNDQTLRVFGDGIAYGTFTASGVVEFNSTGAATNARTFTLTPENCAGNNHRTISVGASGHVGLDLTACP